MFFSMVVGAVIIAKRLEDEKIFCIVESYINKAGRIKMLCFDKTGTLTGNSIKIFGYCICENGKFEETYSNLNDLGVFENYGNLLKNMACCQTISKMDDEFVGDPMEIELFKATNFRFDDGTNNKEEYSVKSYRGTRIIPSRNYIKK